VAVLLPRPEVWLPLAELLGGLGIWLVQRFSRRVLYLSLRVIFVHIADVRAGGTAFWVASNCSAGIGGLRRAPVEAGGSATGTARSVGTGLQWAALAGVEVQETSSAGAEVRHAASEGVDVQGVPLAGAGR